MQLRPNNPFYVVMTEDLRSSTPKYTYRVLHACGQKHLMERCVFDQKIIRSLCVCVCVRVCVRARVRACVRACVRARVRARVRACKMNRCGSLRF